MATVTFDGASRIYSKDAERPAVDRLNLDIADGEFLVLVGPSGCGKSTSLRMLAGLEPTDRGSIRIGGKDVTGVSPSDRDVAMVFQNYALYPNMSVAQNMSFALENRKVPKNEIQSRVHEAAKILQMEDLLDRKPANLSGGSASAWPWAAPSSANRPYSAWTSHYPTWMLSCAFPPARRSLTCSAALAPPPSTSPMTRRRR